MLGNIYPTKYGKINVMFGRLKFWVAQNLRFLANTYAVSRGDNIGLLMLVSDSMVNYILKDTQRYFYGIHGMPWQGYKEEKGHSGL